LLAPITVFYILIIGGGLFETILESLKSVGADGEAAISIGNYVQLLGTGEFTNGFWYSLYLAFVATIIATFLGVIIAYFIITSKNRIINKISRLVLNAGVIIPYLYVIFLAMLYLSKTGLLSRLLYNLGIISDFSAFPQLLNTSAGIGIIWVYVFKGTPFIALFVLNIMSKVSKKYQDISRNLGANRWQVLRKIYIPICSRAIVWSSTILFAYAFGSFEVPFFLSAFSPSTAAVTTFKLFTGNTSGSYYMSMAANVMIFIFGTILVVLFSVLMRKIAGGRRMEQ
jgi:putative spermidine/putrescine transport system permease protein